ncbi:ABC transporter substrate-binding protein [Ruminococcus sp. 5_1_39BFAA]|uniref:ABC transporter substrate-binding protein n=1 Tax=Ruminococcus sp. 5_1_39BFAA TaxID=457412 RepID=UPI00356ADECD
MKKGILKKALSLTMAFAMLTGGAAQTVFAGEADKQTIVYWAQWSENETQAEVLKDAIARFEEANPEYTVEVNWAGRTVRDIMRTSIEAGTVIDVIESSDIPAQLGEEFCQNITEYVKGTKLESDITEGMIAFSRLFTSDKESWYFIPAQPFVGTVFYNKAIFAEAGIEALPENWTEFMDCCQKIVDAGYAPMTIDDAYLSLLYTEYLGEMLGTDGVTELMNETSTDLWSDPAVAQMAKAYEDMAAKGYFTEGTGSFVFPSAQNTEFALGTTAMYINGSWLPNEVAEITGDDFQWGAMFFPSPDGAKDPYTTYMTGCQFYAVPTTSANPEGAVKLIEEFTSEETQKDLLEKCQCIPVIGGLTLPDNLADCGTLMEEATNAVPWNYCLTTNSEIQGIVNASFAKLIAGDITGEDFVEEVQSQLK